MVRIVVRSRDGESVTVEAEEGRSLMEALRDAGLGVAGTCSGVCSCGSCHVYASDAVLAVTPAKQEDEQDMLDALAEVIEVRPCSRLSCQIRVTPELDGATVEIGPLL